MSTEQLQIDYQDLEKNLNALGPLSTAADVVAYLQNHLVPFVGAHVEDTADIDKCVSDLINEVEDILQPETAKEFLQYVLAARALAGKMVELAPKDAGGKILDGQLAAALVAFDQMGKKFEQKIEEITILLEDEDEPDDDEDGDDDEDDEGVE